MAAATERAPMFGVSFFGVTPGFTRRDFCSDDTLQLIIEECSGLHTLDQFTVTLPPNGILYTFGGRMVGALHVTFVGLRRHAIEYKGSREGGHYGVGIWLVDSWIGPDVVDFIDEMMAFLSDQLVNAEGRVIRTFEQIDWDVAPSYLRKLGKYRIDSAPMGEDVFSEGMGRKFLVAHETNALHFSKNLLPQLVQFFRQEPVILRDRVVHTTFDPGVVRAFRELHRIEIVSYKDFIEQYNLQRRASRVGSVATQRSAFASADSNDRPDAAIPGPTIPVHDEYGENAKRPSKKSTAKSPRSKHSISQIASQLLELLREHRINIVAGLLLTLAILLLVRGTDILRFLTTAQNKSEIAVTPTNLSNNGVPQTLERKQGASNATSSVIDPQCLKGRIDASEKDTSLLAKSIRDIEKRLKEQLEGKGSPLNKQELQTLSALVQRERDYLRCLDIQ